MIYPVSQDHGSFYFETETQNKISVVFNDLTSQFEANFPIFCVDIYRIESSSLPNSRVNDLSGNHTRDTIVSIIRNFLDKFDSALVAFIDTSTDSKGRARHRLFQSWFRMYGENEFSITPREIFFSETESYSFLIIRKSYTNADSIIEAFDNFIKLANEAKD